MGVGIVRVQAPLWSRDDHARNVITWLARTPRADQACGFPSLRSLHASPSLGLAWVRVPHSYSCWEPTTGSTRPVAVNRRKTAFLFLGLVLGDVSTSCFSRLFCKPFRNLSHLLRAEVLELKLDIISFLLLL